MLSVLLLNQVHSKTGETVMSEPETKYIRKGKTIKNLQDNTSETFDYVNEAKVKSREIQMSEDGALGRGSLMVK